MPIIRNKNLISKLVKYVILSCCLLLGLHLIANAQDGGRTYTGDTKIKSNPTSTPKSEPKVKSNPVSKTTEKPSEKVPEKPQPPPNFKLPELVSIAPGAFLMGAKTSRPEEQPIHNVELDGFQIGKYEITNKDFEFFVSSTNYLTQAELDKSPIIWRSYFTSERQNYPVVLVSWNDAMAYCKWLSEITGHTFRLPTEAEWEYAARGGVATKYPWGDDITSDQANYDSESERGIISGVMLDYVESVDSYGANGYGLFNVCGNVSEWCYDWYDPNYYKNSPTKNPIGLEKGYFKAIRGGSWVSQPEACRISYRNNNSSTFTAPYLGFRIVKVN